jgi:hypothetical protein
MVLPALVNSQSNAMHLTLPPEMIHEAAQVAIYFVTVVAGLMSFLLTRS